MASSITRRQFVVGAGAAGVGLLAGCGRWPWQPQADPSKVPRIGLLSEGHPPGDTFPIEPFRQGLRERGWIEGQNLAIEYRFAAGEAERLPELAAELVRLPVDVIFTESTPATQAARQATRTIPIVMRAGRSPVDTGLVASLGRPGGNVTGVTYFDRELAPKRLELLKETVPSVSRVGVLWEPHNPAVELSFVDVQAAAPALGVRLVSLEARTSDDLDGALEIAVREHADALLAMETVLINSAAARIVDFSAGAGLPTMYPRRSAVAAGGLMMYGPDISELTQRAAYYVDRILKGTSPADLPVEQPREFQFVVNLKTARELGITFPPEIMLQVTEVID